MKTHLLSIILLLLFVNVVISQSIVNTPHNLSVNGSGNINATSESEICLFCHTPHSARSIAPLWNRNDAGSTYNIYSSSTIKANITQPSGASVLCLSCHDGSVALGSVISRKNIIDFTPYTTMPSGKSNLGTDLRNDHPISFNYNSTLSASNIELKDPSNITPPVSLENGKMQCTSCHDPHKNIYSDFLKASTQYSNLCNSCHQKKFWNTSSHNTSTKTWNGVTPNPWPNSTYTTVAQNACASCHNNHNSGATTRLLKYQVEENNCLDCHNGNVASKNIQAEFSKTYKHNIYNYEGVHDENESNSVNNKHVECADCHNAHATNNSTAIAPNVKGFNAGTKGINQIGVAINEVSYEYEICYRCHADNPATPSSTTRQISQNNVRLEFATGNPSYHAVSTTGINTNVPSLIAPYTTNSKIYCSDCHSSNGTNAPAGPHGSIYPQILKLQYVKTDNTMESSSNYALCYSCHSRTSILSDASFKEHDKHIRSEKTTCNTCHDPHGINSTQGNSTNNSNLINFNTSIVSASSSGILKFEDQGIYKGRCYLTCHGKNHNPLNY